MPSRSFTSPAGREGAVVGGDRFRQESRRHVGGCSRRCRRPQASWRRLTLLRRALGGRPAWRSARRRRCNSRTPHHAALVSNRRHMAPAPPWRRGPRAGPRVAETNRPSVCRWPAVARKSGRRPGTSLTIAAAAGLRRMLMKPGPAISRACTQASKAGWACSAAIKRVASSRGLLLQVSGLHRRRARPGRYGRPVWDSKAAATAEPGAMS